MDTNHSADQPPSAQVFQAGDLDEAVSALLADPRAQVVMESEGRTFDVSAAVRADDFASRTLASLNASDWHRRTAVRTAILLARSEKANAAV